MEKEKVDKFIDDLLDFVESDYLHLYHNFNRDLKYSVNELDEHYNGDYRCLFDKYYEEYCLLKKDGHYPTINITYDIGKDDYLFEVEQSQMIGAEERELVKKKELEELIKKDMKLVEEGRLDEVSPATLWIIGKL